VVVASSDKAYGSQPMLPYTEAMPLLASNPYDASKAITETLARVYHATFGLQLAVTRCAKIYGGGDFNFSRLVPGTIHSVLVGERPVIRSDGSPVRDYLYIDDAVRAYLMLAERLDDSDVLGRPFNFGGSRPISAIELVRLVLNLADATDIEPNIQGTGQLAGEIDQQYLDSHQAAAVLGWTPNVDLSSGLRQTIDWYRQHLSSILGSSYRPN
jgi:CDP-glucose 4,6-dehydratase